MSEKKSSILKDLSKSDLMQDEDIDYSDIPPLEEAFFTKEIVILPKKNELLKNNPFV